MSTYQIPKVKGLEKLSQADMYAIAKAADEIGTEPRFLFTVMSFEAGLDPRARNASSSATGLIQFMPSTARNLGTDIESLRSMSIAEQLPYVKAYFKSYAGRLKTLDDTYLAVFYPAAIGRAEDWVVANEGNAVYTQNAGFDRGKKGYITKGDIVQTIRGVLSRGEAAGFIEVTGPGGFPMLPLVLLLLAGGWLAYQGYIGRRAQLLAQKAVDEAEREYEEVKDWVT